MIYIHSEISIIEKRIYYIRKFIDNLLLILRPDPERVHAICHSLVMMCKQAVREGFLGIRSILGVINLKLDPEWFHVTLKHRFMMREQARRARMPCKTF